MKARILILLFLTIGLFNKVNAQEKKGHYYFAWAYSYDTKSMIISDVKYTDCLTYANEKTDLQNQWMPYLKAEYKDYFKFTKEASYHKTEKEAVQYRRKIMGDWQHSIYKVFDFKFYCD